MSRRPAIVAAQARVLKTAKYELVTFSYMGKLFEKGCTPVGYFARLAKFLKNLRGWLETQWELRRNRAVRSELRSWVGTAQLERNHAVDDLVLVQFLLYSFMLTLILPYLSRSFRFRGSSKFANLRGPRNFPLYAYCTAYTPCPCMPGR